jgi:hypothetical protein
MLNSTLSPPDVGQVADHMRQKLAGQVSGLRVVMEGGRLVLRGSALSYHTRQQAEQAAIEAIKGSILANEIDVPWRCSE